MAKVSRIQDYRSIETRREEWLRNYPDKYLACRNRHSWPDLVPGRKLSTRVRFEPWHDPSGERQGCYYHEETCRNCGRVRWRITGPPGQFYSGATSWKYKDPDGYASPTGLEIIKGDYLELLYQRFYLGDQDTVQALEEHAETMEGQ
jgi:hypothetical protein